MCVCRAVCVCVRLGLWAYAPHIRHIDIALDILGVKSNRKIRKRKKQLTLPAGQAAPISSPTPALSLSLFLFRFCSLHAAINNFHFFA